MKQNSPCWEIAAGSSTAITGMWRTSRRNNKGPVDYLGKPLCYRIREGANVGQKKVKQASTGAVRVKVG